MNGPYVALSIGGKIHLPCVCGCHSVSNPCFAPKGCWKSAQIKRTGASAGKLQLTPRAGGQSQTLALHVCLHAEETLATWSITQNSTHVHYRQCKHHCQDRLANQFVA